MQLSALLPYASLETWIVNLRVVIFLPKQDRAQLRMQFRLQIAISANVSLMNAWSALWPTSMEQIHSAKSPSLGHDHSLTILWTFNSDHRRLNHHSFTTSDQFRILVKSILVWLLDLYMYILHWSCIRRNSCTAWRTLRSTDKCIVLRACVNKPNCLQVFHWQVC